MASSSMGPCCGEPVSISYDGSAGSETASAAKPAPLWRDYCDECGVLLQYYGIIGIGSPPQNVSMCFDTGSASMWVPSADCTTLSCQAHERYAYANSSSFSVRLLPSLALLSLSIASQQCSAAGRPHR